MKTQLISSHEITPAALAIALSESDPKEFAEFWFQFAEKTKPEKLKEFAKAMSPDFGGKRKVVLKNLVKLISYFEVEGELED